MYVECRLVGASEILRCTLSVLIYLSFWPSIRYMQDSLDLNIHDV
jgi:hypothetical protein